MPVVVAMRSMTPPAASSGRSYGRDQVEQFRRTIDLWSRMVGLRDTGVTVEEALRIGRRLIKERLPPYDLRRSTATLSPESSQRWKAPSSRSVLPDPIWLSR